MSQDRSSSTQRLHELDALRTFAMFLGIVHHSLLSFTGGPWVVRDLRSQPWLGYLNAAIHGFRMPLFMLLSGFFTMMLWRSRGLKALLKQRFQRVFIPCMLGLVTIVPAFSAVVTWAVKTTARQDAARRHESGAPSELAELVKNHDLTGLRRLLDRGADPDQVDPEVGNPVLSWAALCGDLPAARLLIEHGADVNAADRSGYRPLHGAAFLGEPRILELLLEHGADPLARGSSHDTPRESARASLGTTRAITSFLGILLKPEADLQAGRDECRRLLARSSGIEDVPEVAATGSVHRLDEMRRSYEAFLTSERLTVPDRVLFRWSWDQGSFHLIQTSVFHHLWFLWFLCWYFVLFAVLATVAKRLVLPGVPHWLVMSPARFCWLIPLTMLPQLFMGVQGAGFGPDTSTGLLLQPHLLLYYGIFFAFGALYFGCDDREGRLGRHWRLAFLIALLAWPIGLFTIGKTVLSGLAQVLFAWAASLGMIGLFRRYLTHESPRIRYLSDSSYWLYVAHVPLVVVLQVWVREWPLPPSVKFLFVLTAVTVFLLFTYETMVRYTWLGRLLNGPRTRRRASPKHEMAA